MSVVCLNVVFVQLFSVFAVVLVNVFVACVVVLCCYFWCLGCRFWLLICCFYCCFACCLGCCFGI